MLKVTLAPIFFVVLSACTTSHTMIGPARAPISPDHVQIYSELPASGYVAIAFLDTTSDSSSATTDSSKIKVVVKRLKAEAARLGANGILLDAMGDQAARSIDPQYTLGPSNSVLATGKSTTVLIKKGGGLAIYVEPDQSASRGR